MLSYSTCFHLVTSSHIWFNTHSNSPIFVGRVLSTPQKKLGDLLWSFFTFISTADLLFLTTSDSSFFWVPLPPWSPETPLPPALQQKSHCFSLASLLLIFPCSDLSWPGYQAQFYTTQSRPFISISLDKTKSIYDALGSLGFWVSYVFSNHSLSALASLLSFISAKMTLLCMCRMEGSYHLPDGKRHIQTLRSWQYPSCKPAFGRRGCG